MKKITIEPFISSLLPAIGELQTAYAAIYPDAPIMPSEVYLSPAFENGRNLFCAIDEAGELVGYAPLYPVLTRDTSDLPHTLWTEIKTHPNVNAATEIKDCLLEQLLVRARELTKDFPDHPIHLTFQYFPSETASVEYVLSKGCKHTESVFTMRRDLLRNIPASTPIEQVVMRPWKMERQTEQKMYVHVRNQCFPEARIELGGVAVLHDVTDVECGNHVRCLSW